MSADRSVGVFRVFEALDELADLVENARAVPLSASCVLPRDHVLDLLEDLREALPGELDDAQAVISAQDELLARARERFERAGEKAESARERALAQARAEVHGMLTAAQQEADRIRTDARAEHERLVTDTEVYRAAEAQAQRLAAEAQERARHLVAEAGEEADTVLTESREDADQLRAEADEYARARLAALAETLARTLRTVEKGRQSLRDRAGPGDGPGIHAHPDNPEHRQPAARPPGGTRERPPRLSR